MSDTVQSQCSSARNIESGMYKKKSVSERICKFCNSNNVEDEIHFYVSVLHTTKGNSFLHLLLTKYLFQNTK